MKTFIFIFITIFSGAIAGALLGLINQSIVEPFIDKAIGIETQRQVNAGKIIDTIQQSQYRTWQKEGEIVAAIIMGVSLASLFGVVFAYTRSSLPSSDNEKKAVILAGLMFVVLFLVPALKYPANPPAVGNPATIYYRESLFIGFIAVSGFSTLGLALLYRKLGSNQSKMRRISIPLIYVAIIVGAYVIFPPNPDKITIPMDLIVSFRIASIFTIGVFWGLVGIIFGAFWDKFKPHETSKEIASTV
ncbi:MAG TPA: CbtA family protein [Nitrososphaeraceae archaeon]|nr:CbtA family protein [Nitrososphaeraceae archaeon]